MAKEKDKYVPDYLNTDLTIVDGQVVPVPPKDTAKKLDLKGVFKRADKRTKGG